MFSQSSPAIRSTVRTCSALLKLGTRSVSTSCSNQGSSDNSFQTDKSSANVDLLTSSDVLSSSSSSSSISSTPSEPLFLRQLLLSLREVEASVGTSQRSLQADLQTSMPLLKPSMIRETISRPSACSTTANRQANDDHQSGEKCSLNLVQSMQLKMALSSLHDQSSSPKPFGGLTQSLEKFQKLIDDEQQLCLENELGTNWEDSGNNSLNDLTLPSFGAIRPKESFLALLVAHLMNPRINASEQNEPIRRHLYMLLNIIQMTRNGSRSRIDVNDDNDTTVSSENNNNGKSSLTDVHCASSLPSIKPYRWSILKGNFYYYNVTYSLMRLNMKNVTQLMSSALQDITGIQFWLEKEARERLTKQSGKGSHLEMNNTVRQQLASGELLSVWASVLAAQEATLLANGCQSVAYLLGKDEGEAHFAAAGKLGLALTHIFSLLDDYCTLKDQREQLLRTSENWSAVGHLHFLLRLPVLLYLKEAAVKPHFNLDKSETECHQIVKNVSTFAIVYYFVCIFCKLVVFLATKTKEGHFV